MILDIDILTNSIKFNRFSFFVITCHYRVLLRLPTKSTVPGSVLFRTKKQARKASLSWTCHPSLLCPPRDLDHLGPTRPSWTTHASMIGEIWRAQHAWKAETFFGRTRSLWVGTDHEELSIDCELPFFGRDERREGMVDLWSWAKLRCRSRKGRASVEANESNLEGLTTETLK